MLFSAANAQGTDKESLESYIEATAELAELVEVSVERARQGDCDQRDAYIAYTFLQQVSAEMLRRRKGGTESSPLVPGDFPALDIYEVIKANRASHRPSPGSADPPTTYGADVPDVRVPFADAAIRNTAEDGSSSLEPEPSPRHPDTADDPQLSPDAEEAPMAPFPQYPDPAFEARIEGETPLLSKLARSVYYGHTNYPISEDHSTIPHSEYMRILRFVEDFADKRADS